MSDVKWGDSDYLEPVIYENEHLFIRDEFAKHIYQLNYDLIRNKMIYAMTIMDDAGRANEEDNSHMLWRQQWQDLRDALFEVYHLCEMEKE